VHITWRAHLRGRMEDTCAHFRASPNATLCTREHQIVAMDHFGPATETEDKGDVA
jgi:hypothetical protein